MGVGLHYKTDIHLPKTTYLFHPHITSQNCVRNTYNLKKQFGVLFGSISKTPYKSTQYKFSDNSYLIKNPKNPFQKPQNPLKNKHYPELTQKLLLS